MKLMATHLNVKTETCSQSCFFLSLLPLSESSPVETKPGYSALLFSRPSVDLWQVARCLKAEKCWNGSSCDPRELWKLTVYLLSEA